jgi:hypothetical protein
MLKRAVVSLALSGLALGLTVASAAQAEPASDAQASRSTSENPMAATTLKLEKAFSDQFVKGQIDREALAPLVRDVIQATPEAAQPRVQAHIDAVIARGELQASQLTPEQRAQVAAPPPASDTVGQILAGWGWPGAVGFGGLGAFGFPGMGFGGWGAGWGTGLGLGTGLGWGWGW